MKCEQSNVETLTGVDGSWSAKNGAARNRFENQSRTIKRRERSKTGVKNTEEEEEEKESGRRGKRAQSRRERSIGGRRRRGETASRTKKKGERKESKGGRSKVSGREKKRMKIAVVKSTRVAPNAINR